MTTDVFDADLVRWKRQWTRSGHAKTTLDEYARQVRAYLRWCAERGVDSASLRAADDFIDWMTEQHGQTARTAARALRAYGRFLVSDEQVPPTPGAKQGRDSGPFHRLQLPVEPAPLRAPMATDDDLARLLATCKPATGRNAHQFAAWDHLRDKAILLVLAHTGMRRGEVASMSIDDVDLVGEVITIPVTKAKQPRRIALHPDAAGAIQRYLRSSSKDRPPDERALWLSITSRPMAAMTPGGVGQMVDRRGRAAGVDVRAHALRRRHSGQWMSRGGSETGLMANSGWKSTAMIQRYSKDMLEANSIAEARRMFDAP